MWTASGTLWGPLTYVVMLDLSRDGHRIKVEKNAGHPEHFLWITVDGRLYFMGVSEPRMKQRDVRSMAARWLDDHPQHLRAGGATTSSARSRA